MTPTPEGHSQSGVIVRREALPRLGPLCRALAEALERLGLGGEAGWAAWRAEVAATCPRCGIPVSGAELLALSRPPAAETGTAKIGRLRLGDCARSGCDCYHYLVTFSRHGQVDWEFLLEQAGAILQRKEHPPNRLLLRCHALPQLAPWLWDFSSARRLCAAMGVVLLLLFARQWYRAGTIPLVRHAEHFRVDPAPAGQVLP